ncbi:PDZ domain-containing protein [Alteraurantiacibacter palmitatis]|uniref:PDZ domain-containing protein n=1 Tax=Alteraurantiacibacter palmitatis TaxID=2054628 RepID=A0ABV7E8I3_9SPHN
MLRAVLSLLVCHLLMLASPAGAQSSASLWEQDLRLASLAERLMGANAHLCRHTMPLTGMIIHSADQYGQEAGGWFVNGAASVAQVLPGSAAEQAGLRPGDGLIAIGGMPVDRLPRRPGFPLRDEVFEHLAQVSGAVTLDVRRDGVQHRVGMNAPHGCRVLVEVLADSGNTARSDGRVIQISHALAARLDESGLAVLFAHELAHAVLEHQRRLREAGVAEGLAAEFGRSRRLTRQAEVEADLLSAHLLANAGFDPAIAPAFWQDTAAQVLGTGLLRSRVYPPNAERARLIAREIATGLAGQSLPSAAAHLLMRRDQPMGD